MNRPSSTTTLISLSPEALAELIADAVQKALAAQAQAGGFMRAKDAAAYLGMSEWALRKAEQKGQVPAHRLGGRVLYDPAELHDFVTSGKGEVL